MPRAATAAVLQQGSASVQHQAAKRKCACEVLRNAFRLRLPGTEPANSCYAATQTILSATSITAGREDRNALLDAIQSVTGKKAWAVCNTT